MADNSKIEWTDATWTPVKGCTRASEGCRNCYAEIMAARFNKPGQWGHGLAKIVETPAGKDHRWTGEIRRDEEELRRPLHWRRPRKVFVCSTADLFHEDVPDRWIDRVFAVMALCPQHTFQVLTKRAERMRAYVSSLPNRDDILLEAARSVGATLTSCRDVAISVRLPLPNVWIGVSVEDQARADERIPHLLATPAAVRWLSCEPLLGPVNITDGMWAGPALEALEATIDWVVAGGESGPGARPMHPDWARSLRDQCAAAGVPFLFKQWGAWREVGETLSDLDMERQWLLRSGEALPYGSDRARTLKLTIRNDALMVRVGKKAAGRLLDGVQHDGYPA